MEEVERYIYEYRLNKQVTPEPELIVAEIKVSVRPKTYKRIGRVTWHSYNRVWLKEDVGKIVGSQLVLTERDDAKALSIFIAREQENVELHKKYLQNAINRHDRIKAISHAIEDMEC
jgi:hypothetical protein